ncbi:DISARM system SNF2-like helicase DrmD [Actinacidiphila oryziradicis]|uniref:DEAD/DEAH box helicase n=1 Tax=Actinacidiphila oryziradicis TaxID=2571141 RepID=A0A4U0RW88_9ACTN|nr:DISARM system SNF2-like helicase DrmD [Actinacidiphila oryziradicis]TKA00500.1 DEAD/DEAH box helicase [Actinacidiphila oryziradicis]
MSAPDALEVGQLVRVRGQQWVVSQLDRSRQPEDQLAAATPPGRTLVTLNSVSDDDLGEELTLVWEVEPGREVVPSTQLPAVTETGWDDPQRLGAFLDAVRWGTVASADTQTLQAPFRSGITIEEYQLEPVARALAMPRVNLLIADDVGLGKTIEAGLVIQELLLRHRARRVLVVCPAPLTTKWREEMTEKFGLDFVVLDASALRELRRTHGLEANPFTVYPRAIISLPWLRTPRVQRLLDEVLTPQTRHPGFFDLLIVDEAHHCAPPAPARGRGYAVDSLQTRAVRGLGEHSQHRLFLSATPHNGYSESWQALLAMLDPQRFTRGVPPDPEVLRQVMVRRLKAQLIDADGQPVFRRRTTRAVDVRYTQGEREIHGLLEAYAGRRRRVPGQVAVRANDLITLLLKKRLFSSPAAFAHTLTAHAATVNRQGGGAGAAADMPAWLDEALGWDDEVEDVFDDAAPGDGDMLQLGGVPGSADNRVQDLVTRAAEVGAGADPEDRELLEAMVAWVERHAERSDSKANALVAELDRICRPGDGWSDERVIIFTEYRDTQRWLAELLDSRGMGGERMGLLFGGMDTAKREHLKAAFQADPARDKVRILLATDTASEGIDLQRHCHRVIHYDIPFNPNRLEQRIGRVDRRGQRHEVEVMHFVGAGWEQADAGSYEGDLEFLSRVAEKVATEREDLGSVNPVLAHAIELRMLGRPVLVDPLAVTASTATTVLKAEQDLREQARKLRLQLEESKRRLHVGPANVRRVVDTALELAGQPPLIDRGNGEIDPPTLRAGWERTVFGLADPLTGLSRPLSFDQGVVGDRDDIVLAHLEHPLVAQGIRLLRSAIWGGRTTLNRVAAVRASLPARAAVDGLLVAVFSRLVVVGKDGARLHEEVVLTGREVPAAGRSRRLELEQPRYGELREAVEQALEPDACRPAPADAKAQLAQQWDGLVPLLANDVRVRASERLATMSRELQSRAAAEAKGVQAIFDQLRATLSSALEGPGPTQLGFDDLEIEERRQVERDKKAWADRLAALDEERERELAAVESRYSDVRELVFPFAVALIVPDPEATR